MDALPGCAAGLFTRPNPAGWTDVQREASKRLHARRKPGLTICNCGDMLGCFWSVKTMSKPKWAPRHGEWGPVKPGFWRIWHANKESLQNNGYSIRKNEKGQWEVRFIPDTKMGWPPVPKPEPTVVPARHEGVHLSEVRALRAPFGGSAETGAGGVRRRPKSAEAKSNVRRIAINRPG